MEFKPSMRRFIPFAGALVAALAVAAPANAACAKTATTKAFSAFGDTADYSLLSGGTFEGGTSGWSLTTAKVAAGSNSYAIGAKGTKSLLVPAGAKVVSPVFCVGVEHPAWRFFAKQASGNWAVLTVKIRVTDSTGRVNETTLGALSGTGFAAWTPTRSLPLAGVLGLWQAGQSFDAQLVFQPETGGGGWLVDDIYIDPYRRS